jgi:hypothetical protein
MGGACAIAWSKNLSPEIKDLVESRKAKVERQG